MRYAFLLILFSGGTATLYGQCQNGMCPIPNAQGLLNPAQLGMGGTSAHQQNRWIAYRKAVHEYYMFERETSLEYRKQIDQLRKDEEEYKRSLPNPPVPSIWIDGRKYASYQEFKDSEHYADWYQKHWDEKHTTLKDRLAQRE